VGVIPNRVISLAIGFLLVFNLLDGAFTLVWTTAGLATEANPLLDDVLAHSPVVFMAIKLALVSLGAVLLVRLQRKRIAVAGAVAAAGTYGVLFLYHLSKVSELVAMVP
jgi:hypothetical protein